MSDLGLKLHISVPSIQSVEQQMLTQKEKAPGPRQGQINSTITPFSKMEQKQAKEKYIIKQPEVKKTLKLKKATRRDLNGIVSSSDNKKTRLYGFKVTPKEIITDPAKKPEVYLARAKKRVADKEMVGSYDRSKAFVAQMKNGHQGIFQRMLGVYRKNPRPGRKKDEKIAELYSLSIPSMIKSRDVAFAIQSKGQKYLEAQVQKEIRRVMGLK